MATLSIDGRDLHYEQHGDGDPIVFVHGGVLNGEMTWSEQRHLADRWTVIVIDRPGFGSSSAVDRVDFAVDAALVVKVLEWAEQRWGAGRIHLVGHSYGGIISLLAAATRPEAVRSLTVIEPPAFALAVGDRAVDDLVDRLKGHWRDGPREDLAGFLGGFLDLVGSATQLPDPLPPPLAQGAAMLVVERGPWEAVIPLDRLARATFPKLVISGGHSAAFDAVCDVLERELGAERSVILGAGHSVPRTGAPFNRRLAKFVSAAQLQSGESHRPY